MKLALVVLALAACGRSKESCKADAEDLGKRLADADHEPSLLSVQGANLVERTDLPKLELEDGPTLRVASDAIVFQDTKVSLDELPDRLREARAKMDEARERYPRMKIDVHMIYVLVDAGATWGQIVRVSNIAAAAELDAQRLVFARPSHGTRPPHSKVEAELEAIVHGESGSITTKLAEKIKGTIEDCPAIQRVFGEVSATEGNKTDYLIAQIPAALEDCNCNLDMSSFATEMWYVMVNEHPTGVLPVQIDPAGTPIELPAITPWREASKQLTPATKTVALRAR